ncbi:alanine/glycine:cation symporter family protein [Piscicoccus intestinalis]|uniref:alanine/glycine:cation symporter family protein n=1 Tax=Piscicoccus intestinalis TaxID=746033 RepID=UPI001C3F344D|nr:amino acid carrier protein [Piscicoccus intestinalis]
MEATLVKLADWAWQPVIWVALPLGLYLSIRTRFVQLRRFRDMLRQLVRAEQSDEGLTPFQALALTVGNRVGVGNVAGVATAIFAGGPGALFWMGLMAFLGAATAFTESVLAQIYKSDTGGELRGGVPYYLEKAFQKRWLGVLAATVALVLYTLLAPGIQANSIAVSVEYAFGVDTWITGVVVTALLGYIIWGGRKRIIQFVNIAVPIMAVGYLLGTIAVLVVNYQHIPGAIVVIFASAFGADSMFGGIIGAAVAWGVRRALFSNVAGVGEGTYAAGAAEVSHPAKQGLVQAFTSSRSSSCRRSPCAPSGTTTSRTRPASTRSSTPPSSASSTPTTGRRTSSSGARDRCVSAEAGGRAGSGWWDRSQPASTAPSPPSHGSLCRRAGPPGSG